MTDSVYTGITAALEMMGALPDSLAKYLQAAAALRQLDDVTIADIVRHLGSVEDPNDPVRLKLRAVLVHWDHEAEPDWALGTARNSEARRARIYDLLDLDPNARL